MGQLRDDQSSCQSRHCTCQCTLCLSNFLGICNKLKPNPLSKSSIVLRIQADQQQSGDHPNCHCADIQRLWKLQSDQVTDPPIAPPGIIPNSGPILRLVRESVRWSHCDWLFWNVKCLHLHGSMDAAAAARHRQSGCSWSSGLLWLYNVLQDYLCESLIVNCLTLFVAVAARVARVAEWVQWPLTRVLWCMQHCRHCRHCHHVKWVSDSDKPIMRVILWPAYSNQSSNVFPFHVLILQFFWFWLLLTFKPLPLLPVWLCLLFMSSWFQSICQRERIIKSDQNNIIH